MQHDLELARAAKAHRRSWSIIALRLAIGAPAVLALWLVPGRFVIVLIWPNAAPYLGFGL